MRWRGLRMRWKIVGPYAVLSLVLALFGAFFVTRLVIGSLEERFASQLAEASRSAADAVVRQERDHLATGRAIAFTQGFATELSDANGNAVGAIALPVAANQNAERVEVLDTSGRRVFGVRAAEGRHVTLAEPMQRSGWSFVQRVLDPNAPRDGKFAGIVDTTSGPVLYSATPARASDGRLVGAVLVGTSLRTFAARAKGEALADVTIYDDGGRVVTTTFPLSADATEQALGMGERGAEAGLVESRRSRSVDTRCSTVRSASVATSGAGTRWRCRGRSWRPPSRRRAVRSRRSLRPRPLACC